MGVQSDLRPRGGGVSTWFARRVSSPGFQKWASRLPVSRAFVRRDGAEVFDILQGFVASQVLAALVELGVLRRLLESPMTARHLALPAGIETDRMAALLQAGAALGLLKRRRDDRYALARKGAAIVGVPGLEEMIRHNHAFYSDMMDPVALLRGGAETNLSAFWPYVRGRNAEMEDGAAARYSTLMARSQELVAQDTLLTVSLKGVGKLLDVGGGSGVFLSEALRRNRRLEGMLFDLPDVTPLAESAFERAGLRGRVAVHGGSFRAGPLPEGADAISLVRVLYDHDDETVADLLGKAHRALPPGGRLIISEPMSGGGRPERAGDVYFAFYTMAMGTGRVRSGGRIGEMCRNAGFVSVKLRTARRPYITSVLSCSRPG